MLSLAMRPHPEDDVLELYALDRLTEADIAPVEEHLLVCQACRDRLVEWDAYVAAMRAAMTKAPEVGRLTPRPASARTARAGRPPASSCGS